MARRGRGARIGIVLIVLLVLLGGGLLIADRMAASAAEDRLTQEAKRQLVASQVEMEGDPKVTIAGFPFLTQVLAGEYQKITISLRRPKINNVQLESLTVDATRVKADTMQLLKGGGDVTATKITGTASMSWDSVRPLLRFAAASLPIPVDVSRVDVSKVELKVVNNAIEIGIPLAYRGVNFTVHAKGNMAVEQGKIKLQLTEASSDAANGLPVVQDAINNAVKAFKDRLNVTLAVPALPYKLVVNKVDTNNDGLVVIASTDNVKLSAQG